MTTIPLPQPTNNPQDFVTLISLALIRLRLDFDKACEAADKPKDRLSRALDFFSLLQEFSADMLAAELEVLQEAPEHTFILEEKSGQREEIFFSVMSSWQALQTLEGEAKELQ